MSETSCSRAWDEQRGGCGSPRGLLWRSQGRAETAGGAWGPPGGFGAGDYPRKSVGSGSCVGSGGGRETLQGRPGDRWWGHGRQEGSAPSPTAGGVSVHWAPAVRPTPFSCGLCGCPRGSSLRRQPCIPTTGLRHRPAVPLPVSFFLTSVWGPSQHSHLVALPQRQPAVPQPPRAKSLGGQLEGGGSGQPLSGPLTPLRPCHVGGGHPHWGGSHPGPQLEVPSPACCPFKEGDALAGAGAGELGAAGFEEICCILLQSLACRPECSLAGLSPLPRLSRLSRTHAPPPGSPPGLLASHLWCRGCEVTASSRDCHL